MKCAKPVVLYFTAKWCAPCRTFGPHLKKVARKAGVKVCTVDVETMIGAKLATEKNVRSVPVVLWQGDRPGAQRITGAADMATLALWLKTGVEDAGRPE